MRVPSVIGPVVGQLPPAGSPRPEARDLAALGYLCEEYFIEGTTIAYGYATEGRPPKSGRWDAVENGKAPYRTRILVLRPADPTAFNGTVLLHWQNVSAGYEIERPETDELYRGYAWVGVSAQEIGLYGSPWGAGIRGQSRRATGLIDADPERYATLTHPGDPGSFEIFTQAARSVRGQHDGDVHPLGGLPVRRIVATGGSQSAMRLVAYANGVHPGSHAVDGFVLSVWEGRAPLLDEGALATGMKTRLRDDLDVPTLIVNSEFEATSAAADDMPDHDRLRVWEVTGTGHTARRRPAAEGRDGWRANTLSWAPVHEAALRRMHEWLSEETPAPAQPRIQLHPSGQIARDELGNALGGIRLPEIATPWAEYRGLSFRTGYANLLGGFRPFSPETIAGLYPSRVDFLDRWDRSIDDLIAAGTLLSEDAPPLRARGRLGATDLPISDAI
ncbi:alpha/beta hydrolase domain-containing protein [Pseudofrankia sp. BMG5.36]|uniref:alpha/beta hydrolase domain-containing protein n=1 Tax=Pseudofrankia sp. BMG5.36 TaxID=1834512 RepID=UPI0008DA49F9|nr:alpha/beta hydrolase domain-containing protein [Pseudofrankia sp. BMG5.36]OHV60864.1 hypothetical protein BCD48_40190 [Pseudofrankia sp. BMG5.36]